MKVMPSMDGFASKVDSSLSGSGASTGSKFGKAFCGAAGKTAGSGFVAKLTGSLSGAAGAFSRSGRASGAAFSGGVLGKAAAFSGGLLCAVGDGLSSVNSVFGSTGTTAGGNMASKVASGFSAKAAVITGVVAGVVQRVVSTVSSSVDAAVARVDTLNNFPKVLQSLGYGADESQRSVDTLSDRLSELPTRLDAAATGVQQLAPSSKSIDQATDRYLAFNDAVLAGGASEDIQSNAMTQLTKAVSTNKMEMDTWMSIQQAMPGQLDQVAKSMLGQSASASDLYQAMKDGEVSVSDFADAVVDLDKNGADGITSFSEQAKAATGGIKTSFSNMCNAFPKGVAKIIGAIGASNIVGVIDGMKGTVNGAFGAITDAMADPSIRDAASSFAAVFSGVVAGGVSVAGDAFAGAVEMTSAFCETLLNNEAASSFAGTLDALGYTASSMGDAIWSTVSQITGWSSPAEGAADAANALDDAFEAAEPVIRSVGDAFQWVSEHSEEVAPVVKGVGGAFLVMKVAGGPVGSLLKVIGGALLSLGVSAPAAGAGLATTAAGETAAGTAAGAAAGKMTSFGAAVLMVGAGVLLACGGIGLLALSAIKLGEAGPQAAIGMAAMVAVIAGLALGAAALGPALTAGSVGMVAFGAAVALAGVGILLAATGLAIMSLALPTIAACGPEAAVGMAALGASLFVLAPGALTASGGLLALAAGAAACAVASAALGMAAIVAGVGLIVMGAGGLLAGAGLSTCSALAMPLAVAATALGAAAIVGGVGLIMLGVGSIVAGAGLAVFAVGATAASLATAALALGMAALDVAMAGAAASISTSADGLGTMGKAIPKISSGAPGAAAGLGALAAAAAAAAPALAAAPPSLASFSASCGAASASALLLSVSVAAVASMVAASMASASASTVSFGVRSGASFNRFSASARDAASAARSAIMGACRQMSAEVGSMRLTLPRINVGPLPHFSMSGKFDAQTGSVPSVNVNWYAGGAVFGPNSPRVIGIGDNRRYDEAAIPLSPKVLGGIGRGVAQTMDVGGGSDGGAVIAWLDRNLPTIIREYTPVTLERDLDRHIRAVAHA